VRVPRLVMTLLIIGFIGIGLESLRERIEFVNVQRRIRQANESVRLIDPIRDCAVGADPAQAVEYLYKLQAPMSEFPLPNDPASNLVEYERKRAIKDIIHYLRGKTGKDLGDYPDPWIRAYGPPYLLHIQTNNFSN